MGGFRQTADISLSVVALVICALFFIGLASVLLGPLGFFLVLAIFVLIGVYVYYARKVKSRRSGERYEQRRSMTDTQIRADQILRMIESMGYEGREKLRKEYDMDRKEFLDSLEKLKQIRGGVEADQKELDSLYAVVNDIDRDMREKNQKRNTNPSR